MKSYTNLEQSKKLAVILPLESADMTYIGSDLIPYPYCESKFKGEDNVYPAWSLASLLDVLPKIVNNETLFIETSAALWHIGYRNIFTARVDKPIDACYEMIIKLHELNLL